MLSLCVMLLVCRRTVPVRYSLLYVLCELTQCQMGVNLRSYCVQCMCVIAASVLVFAVC